MTEKIATKTKKKPYYKCTHCGDEIFWNTRRRLVECKCKAIFVDGCKDYVRVGGNEEDYKAIKQKWNEFGTNTKQLPLLKEGSSWDFRAE